MPLTLLNFTASKENITAQLNWQTSNEVNVSHFNIQRSIDGTNFTTVGKVNAKTSTGLQNDYAYTDDISNVNPGKVYYRLQMTDNDGKFTFSKIVYITIGENNLQLSIHPNPAHNFFIISNYKNAEMKTSNIYVRDLSGKTLISTHFTNEREQSVNISTLAKGMYIVSIVTNGNAQTKKLIME